MPKIPVHSSHFAKSPAFGVNRLKVTVRHLASAFCRLALNFLCQPYRLRSGRTVVFAPHQDDETLGCGGVIARKRNEGLPVDVVFITDGSASHPGHPAFTPADIGRLRRREALAALAILGVETPAIHFLDEPDGTLNHIDASRRAALVHRIAALLLRLRPDEIFLPCSPDGSSEHDAAFGFVMEAIQAARLRSAVWQYPVWSWWNPRLLLERIIATDGRCRVPTEDYQLIKTRALACYRSQTHPLPPQTESTLPADLLGIFNSEVEYFFRFPLPAPDVPYDAPPSVV
jgi:LmbE family N-acetylglucosaminyl deacetylase